MRKLISVVAALLLATAPLAAQQERMRVAVLDFDYATVKTDVAAIFGTDQDIGKGITTLLIDKLVNDGNYRMVDRQAMAKILAEQNFSNSNPRRSQLSRADWQTPRRAGHHRRQHHPVRPRRQKVRRSRRWRHMARLRDGQPRLEQIQGDGRHYGPHYRRQHRRDPGFIHRHRLLATLRNQHGRQRLQLVERRRRPARHGQFQLRPNHHRRSRQGRSRQPRRSTRR